MGIFNGEYWGLIGIGITLLVAFVPGLFPDNKKEDKSSGTPDENEE